MRNKFEQILLSVLWGMSVLLGLTFWLNTKFGFNIFLIQHWQDLSVLQASQTPISIGFYLSFCVAVFIFLIGVYIILDIHNTKTVKTTAITTTTTTTVTTQITPATEQIPEKIPFQAPIPNINMSRPPKLNLPNNIAQIAANHHANRPQTKPNIPTIEDTSTYNPELAEIFTNNAYLVKPDVIISGFKTNLFAIGYNEVVWVGAVNCDLNQFKQKIQKLKTTFSQTLEDIPITVYSFILDIMHKYDSQQNESDLFIFHSIDELKQFISQSQGEDIPESDQENFDAYSEYIDTIIKYIKNI